MYWQCKISTFSLKQNQWLNFDSTIFSWLNSDSNDDQRDSTLTRLMSLIFTADSTLTRLIWVRVESNLTHNSWVEHNPGLQPYTADGAGDSSRPVRDGLQPYTADGAGDSSRPVRDGLQPYTADGAGDSSRPVRDGLQPDTADGAGDSSRPVRDGLQPYTADGARMGVATTTDTTDSVRTSFEILKNFYGMSVLVNKSTKAKKRKNQFSF